MKQQAFSGKERMLKGGLHCHTTRSDGGCTTGFLYCSKINFRFSFVIPKEMRTSLSIALQNCETWVWMALLQSGKMHTLWTNFVNGDEI